MILTRRRLLLAAGMMAAFGGRPARAHAKLTIAYPDKSPPNSWVAEDGRMQGILVDLTAELARLAGYDFVAKPLPLPRVQAEVESGAVDGMCLVVTPARLRYAAPTAEPLTAGNVTLFVRRDNPMRDRLAAVQSLDDLAATGATVIASEGNGWIRANVESRGIRTVFANGTIGTVRMLVGGRGDVIADMSHQIRFLLEEVAGGEAVEKLPAVMDVVDWHLLISRKSPVFADLQRLDEANRVMQASGLASSIFEKYGIKV
ncbi:amino acid ABC transporter substrate-binding protein (PAAT family) [Dongia mobilis]|uniref:Amino acid ABC transporter substrate-binding protein (PAAT family) n=1 Tax=Dongia mobilis TaxID=578943 RepID=A0A4R6X1I9_9PROT|nr:transporter substrate-binding domain-containing protein [Dongia mobilis]TDQ84328.1 amino acid ABC transporter substrate-binding protein (PAAT family) [Dongia mobilis]